MNILQNYVTPNLTKLCVFSGACTGQKSKCTVGHYFLKLTMAQKPYMGSGLLLPPLSEVTILSILMCPPEPSGRQSGDLSEKWRL
jgi:hypothetical protein